MKTSNLNSPITVEMLTIIRNLPLSLFSCLVVSVDSSAIRGIKKGNEFENLLRSLRRHFMLSTLLCFFESFHIEKQSHNAPAARMFRNSNFHKTYCDTILPKRSCWTNFPSPKASLVRLLLVGRRKSENDLREKNIENKAYRGEAYVRGKLWT